MTMTSNDHTEKRVEEVMGSLDNVLKAETKAHFYTRLRSRMENDEGVWTKLAAFISRPPVALTFIVLLLAINFFILFSNKGTPPEDNADHMTALAQEYHFERNSMIDQNTILP